MYSQGHAVFAIVFIASSWQISSTQKCSWVQYAMTQSMCWAPYSMDLTDRMIQRSMSGRRTTPSDYINAFKSSCGKLLQDTIDCHGRVDKSCGYSLIDHRLLKSNVLSLCDDIEEFTKLDQCVRNGGLAFVSCLSRLTYDGNFCGTFSQFRTCVNNLFKSGACSEKIKSYISSAMDAVFPAKCLNNPPSRDLALPRCTTAGILAGYGVCGASFITKMASSARVRNGPQEAFDNLCRAGEVRKMIDCQAEVNSHCGSLPINTDELKAMADSVCSHFTKFSLLADCVKSEQGINFGRCATGLRLRKSGDVMCSGTADMKTCFQGLFSSCDSDIKTTMTKGYDVISLKCPWSSGSKCSLVEQLYTLGVCWFPTAQTMVPWPWVRSVQPYNIKQRLDDICGKHRAILDQSIDCHSSTDSRCDRSLISGDLLKRLSNEMCKAAGDLTFLPRCVTSDAANQLLNCFKKLKTIDLNKEHYLRSMADEIKTCMRLMTAGPMCPAKVRDSMNGMYDTLLGQVKDGGGSVTANLLLIAALLFVAMRSVMGIPLISLF